MRARSSSSRLSSARPLNFASGCSRFGKGRRLLTHFAKVFRCAITRLTVRSAKRRLPVLMDLAAEVVDELARDPRRPVEALLGADLVLQEADEQPEVPRLLLARALPRRHLGRKVAFRPGGDRVRNPAVARQ